MITADDLDQAVTGMSGALQPVTGRDWSATAGTLEPHRRTTR